MTLVYQCDGAQVMARFSGQDAEVWLPEGTHHLTTTLAASGARYAGEGGITFWTRGHTEALLQQPGQPPQSCHAGPPAAWRGAVEAGVAFRAIGQEPGWLLDLYPDGTLHLRADYGTRQIYTTMPEPRVVDGTRVYEGRTDSNALLRLEIVDEWCRDIMSGHPFPKTVQVILDDVTWRGCGMGLGGL
ncbi:MAG: MliC family protein [Rhodospirillaceae bacterium]